MENKIISCLVDSQIDGDTLEKALENALTTAINALDSEGGWGCMISLWVKEIHCFQYPGYSDRRVTINFK